VVNRISRWIPPDGGDEGRLWAELEAVREWVVHLEREVVDLEAAVRAHEGHLWAVVAPLYVELDSVELEIAQARAARRPCDPVLRAAVTLARESVEAAVQQAQRAESDALPLAKATPELQQAYHEAAREMHPDHADSEEEAGELHEWMTRLNDAYARRDEEAVAVITDAWRAGLGPPAKQTERERCAWAKATIAKLRSTREAIDERLRRIRGTDAWRALPPEGVGSLGATDVPALEANLRGRIREARALLEQVLRGEAT
jgi:hypothetical protein